MPAFKNLLAKLGFVRLDSYGLVLTPEGRILATRPAILDDGFGGKIVGWDEGDLAVMELSRWPVQPAQPAQPIQPIAKKITMPPPVPAMRAKPPTAPPVQVAEMTEDEWEWEIAAAKARAAELDDVKPIAAMPASAPTPAPAPIAKPVVVAAPKPIIPIRPVAKPVVIPAKAAPVLPSIGKPTLADRMAAKPATTPPPAMAPIAPIAKRRASAASGRREETIRTLAAPPANLSVGDETLPSLILPAAASSSRRVAAKQR